MFGKLNDRIKKLDIIDLSLIKLSVFFATLIIVEFFPALLGIRIRYAILLTIIAAARPVYKFWIKK